MIFFFTKNPNLNFFFLFVTGSGGPRVSEFFLKRIQIYKKKNKKKTFLGV